MWDEKEIRKQKLGGLLGREPRLRAGAAVPPPRVRARRSRAAPSPSSARGSRSTPGGLSLKPSDGMVGMKGDMGGAAAVLGAFRAIAALGAKVRVIGFLPITDNMTGGDATRVGDVLTIRNGKTVEVLNTDAEGRLILADGLSLATEEAPDAIVDLATLTGACMVALGDRIAGLMGNHDGLDRPGPGGGRRGRRAGVAAAAARLPPRQARQRARRPQEHHRHPLRRRAGRRACSSASSSARASRGRTSTSPARPTPRWSRASS